MSSLDCAFWGFSTRRSNGRSPPVFQPGSNRDHDCCILCTRIRRVQGDKEGNLNLAASRVLPTAPSGGRGRCVPSIRQQGLIVPVPDLYSEDAVYQDSYGQRCHLDHLWGSVTGSQVGALCSKSGLMNKHIVNISRRSFCC